MDPIAKKARCECAAACVPESEKKLKFDTHSGPKHLDEAYAACKVYSCFVSWLHCPVAVTLSGSCPLAYWSTLHWEVDGIRWTPVSTIHQSMVVSD